MNFFDDIGAVQCCAETHPLVICDERVVNDMSETQLASLKVIVETGLIETLEQEFRLI